MTADEILARDQLLEPSGALVRVPLLVRGTLVAPPHVSEQAARDALGDADQALVGDTGARVVRERTVDRATMKPTGHDRLLVLPTVDAASLVPRDPGATRTALAAIPFDALLDWLDAAAEALAPGSALHARLGSILRATSDLADPFLDVALGLVSGMLRKDAVRDVVDRELALGAIPGSKLLDGWVDVDAPGFDGATSFLPGARPATTPPAVRALPTLQLHVTAGNAPVVAAASALRALATRSSAIVKLPSGSIPPGAAIAAALVAAAAGRPRIAPLLEATSFVYWPGGDDTIERRLFDPRALDRVVVWGAPDSVERVSALAAERGIRTVVFAPRYGVSLVGREAFADTDHTRAAAELVARDVLIWNQRACIASMVTYVETDPDNARRFAHELRDALARAADLAPAAPSRDALGGIRRLRRGALAGAEWLYVGEPSDPRGAVILVPGPFELADHPLSRVAIVRPVTHLHDAVTLCHRSVSTAGVHPEPRRQALRDALAARGVSHITPLGASERAHAGMPHDGMRVLSQLVDWATS